MEGHNIDGYIIGEYLGRGSFGIVYKATKNGVTYAIKFIDIRHIADAYDDPKRLDREIEALKRVKSPHTVRYVADGYYAKDHVDYKYIVMEYVDGETLSSIVRREGLIWSSERAIEFVSKLLSGLDVIHANKIIHRDLKLDNIAICADGEVKIIDYGLSKIIDFSSITRSGTVIGAPYFMSPEQIMDGRNITYVSDYYAVGSILFLLLTGKMLFKSVSEQEVSYKTVNVRPPSPSSINPEIPTNVEAVILRLLSKQSHQRYKSTKDIMAALNQKVDIQAREKVDTVKFYPRLIRGNTTIMQTLPSTFNLNGVDFPIAEHKRSPGLMDFLRSKGETIDFIADPGTNRMVYTNFVKTESLKDLPYAPEGYHPYEPEDFEDLEKMQGFTKRVIDLQIANGCTIITAPYFFFDSSKDDWFKLNIRLLRASYDYIKSEYSGYSLSAAICTSAETLSRRTEQETIIKHFSHNDYEYLQLYIDCIQESINKAKLHNYIKTALAIKKFNKTKLIACRVPAVGLGLLTIGFDAITSGLAVLDTFDKSIIEKEAEMARMPSKRYFSDMLLTVAIPPKKPSGAVQDIEAVEDIIKRDFPQYTLNFGLSVPAELREGLSENNQIPKLDFLFVRAAEIQEINAVPVKNRLNNFLARIDKAIDLRGAIREQGISIGSSGSIEGLKAWKEILSKY